MKKLALALVCLVSIAFFASCDPQIQNPKPAISILDEAGCIQNDAVINLDEEYAFGFKVASNAETQVELAQLVITIDDEGWDTVNLTGLTEYTYRGKITYVTSKDSIVGIGNIKATVTDAKNEFATAVINYSLNQTAMPLVPRTFEWFRQGKVITGLDEFGLQWDKNLKATHAQIKPLDGAKLFIFDTEKWEATTTDVEKARLFSAALENSQFVQLYEGINTDIAGDADYDEVIGTITADGAYHLLHITHYHRGAFENTGYPYTITGYAK